MSVIFLVGLGKVMQLNNIRKTKSPGLITPLSWVLGIYAPMGMCSLYQDIQIK